MKPAAAAALNVRDMALKALLAMERDAAYGAAAIGREARKCGTDNIDVAVNIGLDAPTNETSEYSDDGDNLHNAPPRLPPRDLALLRELVYGVTRWKLTLDYIIFQHSTLKKNKVAPAILAILRLGAYQIKFLDRVPNSAACDESVKLARKYGNAGAIRFVNAVLRKISSAAETAAETAGRRRNRR